MYLTCSKEARSHVHAYSSAQAALRTALSAAKIQRVLLPSMLNVFPRAQPAAIEEVIGRSLPNAHPPDNQRYAEPASAAPRAASFTPFGTGRVCESLGELEKRIFSEPDYARVKNALVSAYRQAGGRLTLGSCKGVTSDFPFLLRVFNFLEDHHVINHAISVKEALDGLSSPDPVAAEALSGNCHSNKSGARPVLVADASQFPTAAVLSAPGHGGQLLGSRVKYRYTDASVLRDAVCFCGGKAHYFTSDHFFICDRCFGDRRYPSSYAPRSFHRITERLLRCLWTRREEYMLLKSIEEHGDDWRLVAASLGKSIEQCIFHFIKMPLVDDIVLFHAMPFSTVPNPVSTYISYVAYMVHAAIAARMAKAAIAYYDRPNIMSLLTSVAIEKAKEILEIERAKKERLEQVLCEAKVRCLLLKTDAIGEMYCENMNVRNELEEARAKLADEARGIECSEN